MRSDDLANVVHGQPVGMLCRNDNRGRACRLTVDIPQRDLALCVRTQARLGAGMTRLGERAQNGVRVVDRRRHQHMRLIARISEHDSLIARAFVFVARGVNADGDVG